MPSTLSPRPSLFSQCCHLLLKLGIFSVTPCRRFSVCPCDFFLFLGVTFVLRPADAVPVPVIPADPTLGSGRGRQGGGRGGSWRKGSASLGAHPAPSRGLRSFLWGHFLGAGCPELSKHPTSKKMPFFFFCKHMETGRWAAPLPTRPPATDMR